MGHNQKGTTLEPLGTEKLYFFPGVAQQPRPRDLGSSAGALPPKFASEAGTPESSSRFLRGALGVL